MPQGFTPAVGQYYFGGNTCEAIACARSRLELNPIGCSPRTMRTMRTMRCTMSAEIALHCCSVLCGIEAVLP
jgi:hypothetical protein